MKTALTLAAVLGVAAAAPRAHAEEPQTRQVVAGSEYSASGIHQLLFGADYRKLWTTPVTVEVLDLQKEAGGLAPVRRVGGEQTKGLALKGKDGRNYTFRGLEKGIPSALLEEELKGTVVERTLKDQMSGQHPASEAVASVILDAAGVPYPTWRLVVMPDDPALGEFRKDFAGAMGAFGEYPSAAGGANPGFRGITEIIDHLEMYKKLEAGQGDAIDDQALLRARLADLLIGDWDRHRKQWRWARVPGNARWVPIPEDRDQAFSRYEGLVLQSARGRDPRFHNLKATYGNIGGLTFNGWDQDRRLLSGLAREDFQRAATELRGKITDDVLRQAVAAMPAEWQKIDGARLLADLKARRDALPQGAEAFYRHLADRVDVYMTDQPERVEAKRSGQGDLEVTVAAEGQPGAPSFHRLFRGSETEEVRLYALGGNDNVVVSGSGGGPKLRVIGGAGDDRLDARQGGGAKLSDDAGSNTAEGAGLDRHPYVTPAYSKNAPWIPPRDWGSEAWTLPWVGYNTDTGVFLGGGIEHRSFSFRKNPYASRQVLKAGWGFGGQAGKADYTGEFNRENSSSSWGLHAYASGLDVLRFYGFGNETVNSGDEDFFKADANQFVLYPSFRFHLDPRTTFQLGPTLKYTQTKENRGRFIETVQPYGSGDFGEVGVHGVISFDGRDSPAFTRRGVLASARGTLLPGAWDVEKTFGEVNGDVNAYASAGKALTLAVRVGGKKVFGDLIPYHEAAVIGGGHLGSGALDEPDYTVRGFRARRFSGDASLYGNADLRLRVSRITIVLPGDWGLLGFADTGRVWLDGEDSNTWHTGAGGGIWISFLNYRSTLSAGLAHSKEDDVFYFKGGFTF